MFLPLVVLVPEAERKGVFASWSDVLCIHFEAYKSNFERWVRPPTDWLHKREAWFGVIPVAILVILSFPPLPVFGHKIVQLFVAVSGQKCWQCESINRFESGQ